MKQQPATGSAPPSEDRATRWLSHGFETLIASLEERKPQRSGSGVDFDVVIVGTGYGGSVAAAELARTRGGKTVCVLERGREHLPGSFPFRMSDLAGEVRFSTGTSHHPRGRREGLFDVRIGDDLCALVASGVGGGSLINAGVMALPHGEVFGAAPWPKVFHRPAAVKQLLASGAALKQRLGATQTVKSVPGQPEPRKYTALGRFTGVKVEPLPITVALTNASAGTFRTAAGIDVDACVRCGNCASGCNYNAKVSLDATLLAEAAQHGARLFAGATVLKIEKLASGRATVWQLHVVHTDEALRRRQGKPTLVRARRVVLAAGTFGSTEILLRSQGDGLALSGRLGHQVSSNGDLIAAAYGGKVNAHANCVADEDKDPRLLPIEERVGPTITGMVDLRETDGMVIQDLSVPGPLRCLLEQTVTTASAIHMLAQSDPARHDAGTRDECAVDAQAIDNTLVVAILGHDSADGVMKLNASDSWDSGDGAATIRWPALRDYPPLLARHRRFEQLIAASKVGAAALPNPMWRLLPQQLDYIFGAENGPLLTVHPLGGCPMGDDAKTGVTDDCGRVFDPSATAQRPYHQGLVVLDGSIVPASLGINPALTIATLALRATRELRKQWRWDAARQLESRAIGNRPYFRRPGPIEPARDTLVEVVERLSGPVALGALGLRGEAHVELTLRFDPISIRQLTSGTGAATLELKPGQGRLRIFATRPRDDLEAPDEHALLIGSLAGSARVFSRGASAPIARQLQGWGAWFRNRGLRDSVLWAIDRFEAEGPAPGSRSSVLDDAKERLKRSWELSSRAGAVRLLEYDLRIDAVSKSPSVAVAASFIAGAIRGEKRLTYARRANPWRQLMELSLKSFPRAERTGAVLSLDTGYLARQGIPLFRVVQQQDMPRALVDVASLGLYLLRMLLLIHVWSFRLPDTPRHREIQRLPGDVPGLPRPEVHEFRVARPSHGVPVKVRLTHYPYGQGSRARALAANPAAREAIHTPILFIHGYSASGTTFAHHAVRPNLARSLWERGRDVWIADLRTSAGMPHASEPWTFEEVGLADIPVAVHQVCELTGAAKIDVFAHCMGSAMLGMALLGSHSKSEPFAQLRRQLPDKIRRLVMSQVAPAVVFTPENVFRAYAMRYLKHYLPLDDYQFRPAGKPRKLDQLIDRLLATLPYPESEFDRENPFWQPWRRTPWVGTRHRMDALYGRDFSVNNLPGSVLDYIDDHFGPLNIDTVSQAIYFARYRTITNRRGFNDYVTPEKLREQLRFPILHVHGKQNGLVSKYTPIQIRAVLRESDAAFKSPRAFLARWYKAGHQDLLIGHPAAAMFKDLNAFLEKEHYDARPIRNKPGKITFASQVPSFGVRVNPPFEACAGRHSLADHPARGAPLAALLVPVVEQGDGFLPVGARKTVAATAASLARVVQWRAVVPVSPGREATRLTLDLADYKMPTAASGILVLLLYSQAARVVPPPAGSKGGSLQELARQVLPRSTRSHAAAHARSGRKSEADAVVKQLVQAMASSVEEAFDKVDAAELALGILRPPRRDPSRPLSATRSFALASCQYPGGLLDRTPPGATRDSPPGPSDASYLRLLALLEGRRGTGEGGKPPPVPEFLVLAGDQVYCDATAGLFDPRRLDDRHRISYETFFGSRGSRSVLSRLPAVMRLDDHEIDNDWEPDPPGAHPSRDPGNRRLLNTGVEEFLRNQCDQEPGGSRQLWHQTPVAGFAFFWADTRTRRTARTAATVQSANLLGERQSRALDQWLADRKVEGPRFVVSAQMVLPRRLELREAAAAATCIRSDAWDGYPASLHRLLAGLYRRGTNDVVFLSGDEHLSNVARIEITRADTPGRTVVAHSVHSSALYAPYPFANAIEADFANTDEFVFSWRGANYRCRVRTWFPARGDGFAVLSVSAAQPGWLVSVRFDREQHDPADRANIFDFPVAYE